MIKKTVFALAAVAALSLAPQLSFAEDAPAAPAAPAASPLTFNVGLVTDYRYRGISQSRLKPALQGGADYAFASGAYVGTWASTINWVKDNGGGNSPVEWDLYGGYKGEIAKDFTYDVGALAYVYLNNKYDKVALPYGGADANTLEIYGALTYGIVTAKYSHALTDLFGNANSKNSGYLEVAATFDLGSGWSLAPHVGHQSVKGAASGGSYTDYSLTVGKDLGNGITLSAAAVGTDADKTVYYTPAGKFTGKSSLVVGVKYGF
jgi:uncharacterized protein (TIGR02001 family)